MIVGLSSRWRTAVLVCAKCEKKLDNRGFGPKGDKRLSKLLRKQAGAKGRKAGFGVISSKCLNVCPKGAVTVIDAARPRDWMIVSAGTPIEEVDRRLGMSEAASRAAE